MYNSRSIWILPLSSSEIFHTKIRCQLADSQMSALEDHIFSDDHAYEQQRRE